MVHTHEISHCICFGAGDCDATHKETNRLRVMSKTFLLPTLYLKGTCLHQA